MNYPLSRQLARRCGLRWLALLTVAWALGALCAGPALAQALRVAAFSLVPPPDWQRADSATEAEQDAFLLHASQDLEVQVVLPRMAPMLKVGEADYLANLRRQWQVRHGIQVRIDEPEIAGLRWLMVRRRAQDGATTLFQLSRVHAGRAYSVLVFAPSGTRELPQPVRELLAHARFGEATTRWHLSGRVWARPSGASLQVLLAPESDADQVSTMVTGYGLTHRDDTVRWFAEGFDWVEESGRATRRHWHQGGHLQVTPPAVMESAAGWPVRLAVDAGGAPVVAGLRLWPSCAPPRQLERALERLQQGVVEPLRRLLANDAMRCGGQVGRGGHASLRADAGQTVERTLVLPWSERPARGVPVRQLVVEVWVEAQAEQPMNALLGAVRGVYLYRTDGE